MHVSGFPLDLNWFLQFIVTAFIIAFGLLHLVKNTASKYFMVDANFDSPDPSSSPPPLGRGGGEGRKMPGVSATAADSCVVCGNSTTKQCSGCKLVRYCSGACQTSHWKSGHKTKCKDFQLSGQVKSMQSAYMQHGRRDSSAVALVPSSGTVNITKQSKEILFPYEDFVELFNWDKRGFPPCGLLNCGNSCFANVVLQCLVYTRPLVAYLLEKGHRKECRRNDWCFLCEFQTHVERSSESRHPFSPINILSRLPNIGGDLGYGKQEDAHEFMRFAIDTMQSVCLDEFGGERALHPSTQETTLIQHIFGGHLQSQVICSKCNNVSNQYENMMDLTVEIQGDATSLEECLDLFTVREWLHGDNMYKCDGCNEYVMAWKRLTVRRAPNILTIALKRFQSGRFGKLNKRVTFPETLDLSPYMSEVGDGNNVYKLYAVVVHVDMLNASFFGHYICYTKDFCGKWYRIDDCKVMRVDLEEVLSQGAYMLLYSRVCARPSCLKPIESLTKGKQQTVQEGEPHVKQSVEFLTTAESINGICTSGSLSSDSDSQEKVSTCEKERTNSEDVREDIEMVDSESSSSVPQDIEVHGNGYSHAIEETASPVVHANRLVSAVGSSLIEMVKPEAYSLNSESDFPHSAVDENTAERSSAEKLTESSSESAQPIQNGVCEEGKISHDAPVGNLSSGELLDEISPVDCNGEQAKMETGKGLPSSSSTKDATGKLARRNSSEGKLKPLFPPGFLRKHSGNNSPKRGGKAKTPSELAECASSYNPNKVISGFAKPGFLNQNGARTKDVGKSHSKCSSSSSPTFEERVGNHLDKDAMVLSGSGDFNHCNGDSGAFVISDEGISYISGDDQPLAGKTSSYKEELHESETTPEKIRTDSERPVESDL
ncbi:hypothetical protein ACSBR1_037260 [Camellia fascicularis]